MGASVSEPGDEGTIVLDAASARLEVDAPTRVGDTLGRYVVLDELGRGAMGIVLRAYDPRLQREVALKRLPQRAITDEDRARVVREARALARIAHPNVVAVFDVENDDRSITLVMEHVRGAALGSWLATPRDLPEILRVLADVGRGLAAAHAERVLHRDVKPANVIVGDDGRARILDFGLARYGVGAVPSTEREAVVRSGEVNGSDAITRAGTVMGTPSYMAPEQHVGAEVTAAADQFAFCVMAWEAIGGARPFVAGSYEELVELKHRGPPPWPKHARWNVPGRIVAAIRRGLSPDPAARWPSMLELVAVLAADPARRRRQGAWLGVTLLAAASTYVLARREPAADDRCTGGQSQLEAVWDDAQRGRAEAAVLATALPFAEAAWQDASARLDRYTDDWVRMHREACEATTVRHEQSAAAMDLRMACLDRARDDLAALTRVMTTADGEVVGRLGVLMDGLPPLERCADLDALEADVEPPSAAEADAVAALRSQIAEAKVQRLAGKYAIANERMATARATAESLAYRPVLAEVLVEQGLDLEVSGEWARAEPILRQGFELALGHGQRDEAKLAAINLVALLGDRLDRYPEAHVFASVAKGLIGRESDDVLHASSLRSAVARVLYSEGKHDLAEQQIRGALELLGDALPADSRELLERKSDLVTALRFQRRLGEARTLAKEVLDARIELLGAEHPDVADALVGLSKVDFFDQAADQSEAWARRALAIRLRALGEDHPATAEARGQLGSVLAATDRFSEAVEQYDAALAGLRRSIGPSHARIAGVLLTRAEALRNAGKLAEARATLEESTAMFDATLGPDHVVAGIPKHILAQLLLNEGDLEQAEKYEREALRIMDAHDHPVAPALESALARILLLRKDLVGAVQHAERAYESKRDTAPREWTHLAFDLAKILWEAGHHARALEVARECAAQQPGPEGIAPELAAEVTAWLAAHEGPGAVR